MENYLSQSDLLLIEKEISRKSFRDIAFLLDQPLEELRPHLLAFARDKDIIPYQQLLDEKKKPRAPRPKKEKKKQPVIISRRIEQAQKQQRQRANERKFATRQVDWSQMHLVKIDARTSVLARKDEDPAAVIRKYHQNMKNRNKPQMRGVSLK